MAEQQTNYITETAEAMQMLHNDSQSNILKEMDIAEVKAWDALSRYKFWMFGYWAAIWVHLNRISRSHHPNPWIELVRLARRRAAK